MLGIFYLELSIHILFEVSSASELFTSTETDYLGSLLSYEDAETEDAKEIQGNGTLSNDREAYKHLLQTLLSNRLGRSRRFNSCGRHELYINFTEIGLDYYIIQPPGYDAFYCDGSCPLPVETTSHAVLQAMVNTFAPDKSPQPCCVPKSFDPLSVIRSNGENEVVKEDWVDMIVVDCVCR